MPRSNTIPSYRLHAASGQAVVTLSGDDVYLGKHNTPESRSAYDRAVSEWMARGRLPSHAAGRGLSVNELILAYVEHSRTYYRGADGQPTREIETMGLAFRPLRALYELTDAGAFSPLCLEAVRDRMIREGLSRGVINQRVGYIRRMFRWASSKMLVPPTLFHALQSVENLRRGRSSARETEPVTPVPDAYVDAIVPFLPTTLRVMLTLQRLTGMRSGELVTMCPTDIDVSGNIWLYRPARHKTAHLDKVRLIPFGPQCRLVLEPLLTNLSTEPLFSPRQANLERDQAKRKARKTPVQPSQVSRRKARPRRQPGDRYTSRTYYAALRHAMDAAEKAGVLAREHFWHPHQLRHNAALRIRREMSVEAARSFLGHAKPAMTEHYAGLDEELAKTVAARFA